MNKFGTLFNFTTWGESHGKAIGCVVDGVPSGIEITEAYIKQFMDERKPGNSKFVSQRKEGDSIEILSGILDGKTLGSPISIMIKNEDARAKDYKDNEGVFRPSHADYTYYKKYGLHDWSGGGRSSARETACRVIAGAIARKILPTDVKIESAMVQIGELKASNLDFDFARTNPLRCPDPNILDKWEKYIKDIRKQGTSVGAMVKIRATGVPIGLGQPVYGKLDAKIAEAMMGINAVKSVEIGAGSSVASALGHEHADQMAIGETFLSNNSGGILGGISNGQDIEVTVAVKPASSILQPLSTVNIHGQEQEISTKGRHDPCIGIRACPVAEAMLACVLADYYLLNNAFNK